jgi:hypothetical protein
MKTIALISCVVALLCMPAASFADWSEDFDSYLAGSQIVGQGGWEEWGPGSGGLVSNLYSRSPENSLEDMTTSDIVHQYSDYTTGKWFYRAWLYIPSTMSGQPYFILLNTYNPPTYVWSVQFSFLSTDGMIHCDCGAYYPDGLITVPFVTDEWAEILVYVDLDEDWVQIYYNGQLLDDPAVADDPVLGGGYQWTAGPFGEDTGALNIAAVDLYANSASAIYYDDMSLAPAETYVDLKVNGGDAGVQIPVGTNIKINYAVIAGPALGNEGDVWLALKTPLQPRYRYLTFDGDGPILGWNLGLANPLASEALGNYTGVALDAPGPVGAYRAFLGIDGVANGVPDFGDIIVLDTVDFDVTP